MTISNWHRPGHYQNQIQSSNILPLLISLVQIIRTHHEYNDADDKWHA